MALALAVLLAGAPSRAGAQAGAPPNPRAAQPERPTVATHAYTVAPGWLELEAGALRQQAGALADRVAVPILVKIGVTKRLQLDLAPAWQRDAEGGRAQSGVTDLLVGVKWRVADEAPVLGAFAIQSTLSLPTGSPESGRGSGKAAVNVLLISSHRIGPLSLDVNAGYARLGGESTVAPRDSTVWTAAAAVPVAGRVGWATRGTIAQPIRAERNRKKEESSGYVLGVHGAGRPGDVAAARVLGARSRGRHRAVLRVAQGSRQRQRVPRQGAQGADGQPLAARRRQRRFVERSQNAVAAEPRADAVVAQQRFRPLDSARENLHRRGAQRHPSAMKPAPRDSLPAMAPHFDHRLPFDEEFPLRLDNPQNPL